MGEKREYGVLSTNRYGVSLEADESVLESDRDDRCMLVCSQKSNFMGGVLSNQDVHGGSYTL